MVGRRHAARIAPVGAALVGAVAFLIVSPPVGDLWAARARDVAVAGGVGLHYWFAWFAGVVPGHYSVLAPYLTHAAGAEALGAGATVATTVLVAVLTRDTERPVAATWVAAIAAGLNLWSGRVPFAVGAVVALIALLAVTRASWWAVPAALLTVLVSPVAGAFLLLALVGVIVHQPARRAVAIGAVGCGGGALLALGVYFGAPGPEGFPVAQAVAAVGACVLLDLARPAPAVRTVVRLSLVVCVVVALVPNGLGSNFERFTWLCLPVAVVATGRTDDLRAVLAGVLAVGCAGVGSAKDLWVAAQPQSGAAYYAGAIRTVDRTPGLSNHRLEVVPDGTHAAAALLLGHAALARGYETQSDAALNGVLLAPRLDATAYRRWLDRFAVSMVLLDRHTLHVTPEDDLIRHHRPPYLYPVWADAHLVLYGVRDPTPIVGAPALLVRADQAELRIRVPRSGTVHVRIHWSHFLHAGSGRWRAPVEPAPDGFVLIDFPAPGTYAIRG